LQDNSPVASQDIIDAGITSTVVPIAGELDVPIQMLEQSPAGAHLDWAMFKDLGEAYDHRLEVQLLAGTGTGSAPQPQLLGLANISGITTNAYTATNPAPDGMFVTMAQTAAQLADSRSLAPECWLMRTARWLWLSANQDGSGRPFTQPSMDPPPFVRKAQVDDGYQLPPAVANLWGWPVFTDDAIPATLGTGSNRDELFVIRPSDMILLESAAVTNVFTQVLSGTLQVRLQYRAYAAALTGRKPAAVGLVNGSGFVVQTGW
jgi:hypothetical protein